jgi:hypothetical protein
MGTVRELRPGQVPPASSSRVRLRKLARLDVEQAREFLLELDGRIAGADLPRLAYLVGVLEGHAQNLMDVIDAVAEVGCDER